MPFSIDRVYQLHGSVLFGKLNTSLAAPRASIPPKLAGTISWATTALVSITRACSSAIWLLNSLNQPIQDDEFKLELQSVYTRLEGTLEVEKVGALDAEKHNIESYYNRIRV